MKFVTFRTLDIRKMKSLATKDIESQKIDFGVYLDKPRDKDIINFCPL